MQNYEHRSRQVRRQPSHDSLQSRHPAGGSSYNDRMRFTYRLLSYCLTPSQHVESHTGVV